MRRLGQAMMGVALAALATSAAAQAQAQVPAPPRQLDAAAAGRCMPQMLFRATIRNVSPGLQAFDKQAQPRTIYRQGTTFLRVEEQPDPQRGDQILVIVAEPDLWTLNLATRQGRHAVDPGPVLEVKAPILPPSLDMPEPFKALEYGCEAAFVAQFAPRQQRVVPWGATVAVLYGVTIENQGVAILMDQKRNEPLMISYMRDGKPVYVIRYDEYRQGLPEKPALFAPPKSYKITEAPPGGGIPTPP